jgi:hypothetical protein
MLALLSLFNNPFDDIQTTWIRVPRHPQYQSLFKRYRDLLDHRLFTILNDDAAELLGLENHPAQENLSTAAQSNDQNSTKVNQTENDVPPVFRWHSVSQTKSMFNGQDYVEEHREKVTESNGETRVATRRRLGDRWHESEVHIDKDGKKTEREVWHNVPNEDADKFNVEWHEKHNWKVNQESLAGDAKMEAIESKPGSNEPRA